MPDIHIELLEGGRIVDFYEYRHRCKGYQVYIYNTHLVGSVFLSREPDFAKYAEDKGLEIATGTDLIAAYYLGGGGKSEISYSDEIPAGEIEAIRGVIDEEDDLEGHEDWNNTDHMIRLYKPFVVRHASGDVEEFK